VNDINDAILSQMKKAESQSHNFGVGFTNVTLNDPENISCGSCFPPGPGVFTNGSLLVHQPAELILSISSEGQVPEPGTLALLGTALGGLAWFRRRLI